METSPQESSSHRSNPHHEPGAFAAWGAILGAALGGLIGLWVGHWALMAMITGSLGWGAGALMDRSRT